MTRESVMNHRFPSGTFRSNPSENLSEESMLQAVARVDGFMIVTDISVEVRKPEYGLETVEGSFRCSEDLPLGGGFGELLISDYNYIIKGIDIVSKGMFIPPGDGRNDYQYDFHAREFDQWRDERTEQERRRNAEIEEIIDPLRGQAWSRSTVQMYFEELQRQDRIQDFTISAWSERNGVIDAEVTIQPAFDLRRIVVNIGGHDESLDCTVNFEL